MLASLAGPSKQKNLFTPGQAEPAHFWLFGSEFFNFQPRGYNSLPNVATVPPEVIVLTKMQSAQSLIRYAGIFICAVPTFHNWKCKDRQSITSQYAANFRKGTPIVDMFQDMIANDDIN